MVHQLLIIKFVIMTYETLLKEVTFLRLIRAGIQFYLIGLITLTLGIALTILSTLGASPFDALLVGLFRTVGLTIGSWEVVVGLSMILANAIALRKKPEFYALITSVITGLGIDAWMFMLERFVAPETWIGQYVVVLLGIFFIALGVATYLQSTIAPNPMDRSMMVLSKLSGMSVSYSRAIISVILVVIAFIFNGDIGIGTLINALFSGVIISYLLPYLNTIKSKTRAGSTI